MGASIAALESKCPFQAAFERLEFRCHTFSDKDSNYQFGYAIGPHVGSSWKP